jgi:hypothetical protein
MLTKSQRKLQDWHNFCHANLGYAGECRFAPVCPKIFDVEEVQDYAYL